MLKLLTVKPKTKAAYQAYVDALTEDREMIERVAYFDHPRKEGEKLSDIITFCESDLSFRNTNFLYSKKESEYRYALSPTIAYFCPTAIQEVFGDDIMVLKWLIMKLMCTPYWFTMQYFIFHRTSQYHPELLKDVEFYGKSTTDLHQGWYPKHNFDHFLGLSNVKLLRTSPVSPRYILNFGIYVGRKLTPITGKYKQPTSLIYSWKSRIDPKQPIKVEGHHYKIDERGETLIEFDLNDKETGALLASVELEGNSLLFMYPLKDIKNYIGKEEYRVLTEILTYVEQYLWEQVTQLVFAKSWFKMVNGSNDYRFFSSAPHEEKVLDLANIEPDINFDKVVDDTAKIKKATGGFDAFVLDDKLQEFYNDYISHIAQGRPMSVLMASAYFPAPKVFQTVLARTFPNYLSAQNHEGMKPMIQLVGTPNGEEELLYENDLLYFNEVKYEKPTLVKVI